MEIKVYHVPGALVREVPQHNDTAQSHWAWEHQSEYVHVGTINTIAEGQDAADEAYGLCRNVDGEWDEDDDRVTLEVDCPRGTQTGDVFYQNGFPYVVTTWGFERVVRPPTETELKKEQEDAEAKREAALTPEQRDRREQLRDVARQALAEIEAETKANLKKPPE
jgi:hypothetical protein